MHKWTAGSTCAAIRRSKNAIDEKRIERYLAADRDGTALNAIKSFD